MVLVYGGGPSLALEFNSKNIQKLKKNGAVTILNNLRLWQGDLGICWVLDVCVLPMHVSECA